MIGRFQPVPFLGEQALEVDVRKSGNSGSLNPSDEIGTAKIANFRKGIRINEAFSQP